MTAVIFIIGASIGSFLNVLIDRLPNGKPITGRSRCDHCEKKLSLMDLIPILSFVFLRGRSRCCKKKLSWQYPLVEALTGLFFVFVYFQGQNLLDSVLIMGIMSCLIVIFFSDLKYHLISDYILIAFGVFTAIFQLQHFFQYPFFLFSSIIVALPIFLIYYISHERAMGLGDVYLSVIIGFLLGWKEGFLALYIAFITGAIFGLTLIILKKKKIKSRIPFGPFLVIGTVMMLFWRETIFAIINKIYGF